MARLDPTFLGFRLDSGVAVARGDPGGTDEALASKQLKTRPRPSFTLRRTFDTAWLNSIANHPEVHPWTGVEGPAELGPIVANPMNFALKVNDGGAFVLINQGAGVYEVHSLFVPEARGSSIRAMRAGMEYMFCRTDCAKLVTQVPDNNPAASALAKLGRFRPMFRREETPRGPTAYLGLSIDEWAQDCSSLEAEGEWFHSRLEAGKQATGSELPTHEHDAAHERAVGATVKMVKAGNITKGVDFYNRWARLAGYAQIGVVSTNPPTIDVVDAVVEWRDNEMEVLLCR